MSLSISGLIIHCWAPLQDTDEIHVMPLKENSPVYTSFFLACDGEARTMS